MQRIEIAPGYLVDPSNIPAPIKGYLWFSNFGESTPDKRCARPLANVDNVLEYVSDELDLPDSVLWVMPFAPKELPEIKWAAFVQETYRPTILKYFGASYATVLDRINEASQKAQTGAFA